MEFTRWLLLASLLFILNACGSVRPINEAISVSRSQIESANSNTKAKQSNPYWKKQPSVQNSAEALFTSALISLELNELELAQQQFSELSHAYPRLSGPWVNLGIIEYKNGQLGEAESNWQKAIKLNPLNFDAYANLGILKREQGDFSAAESVYKRALKKWPDNAEIRCNLGILYDLYQGEQVLALREYQLCEELSDEPPKPLRGWIVDLERRTQALVRN